MLYYCTIVPFLGLYGYSSSPFQVRYKSVLTPFLRMGGEKTHDTDERFAK